MPNRISYLLVGPKSSRSAKDGPNKLGIWAGSCRARADFFFSDFSQNGPKRPQVSLGVLFGGLGGIIENADATPPHLDVLVRLGSSADLPGSLKFLCEGVAQPQVFRSFLLKVISGNMPPKAAQLC